MTDQELNFLQNEDSVRLIDKYINDGTDAHRAALLSGSSAIASQVKYLARAERKLPSYYNARCTMDADGFEQCSSEKTANAKFAILRKSGHKRLAIDLTCGLGVDSFVLSGIFDRVISVELDSVRAQLTGHNFTKLGAHNIELLHTSAEEFLQKNQELKADVIYIDPSRKVQGGRRVFSIRDSSPNVLELIDTLRMIAPKIIIKLSPMFDIEECFRLFGSDVSVEVISLDGECKELLVGFSTHAAQNIVCTMLRGSNHNERQLIFDHRSIRNVHRNEHIEPRFLYVPDASIIKSRVVGAYISSTYSNTSTNCEGYVLSEDRLEHFCGQEFSVTAHEAYHPKKLRKTLLAAGIRSATVSRHNFPHPTSRILSDLGIKDGGMQRLFFSTYKGEPTIFFATKEQQT